MHWFPAMSTPHRFLGLAVALLLAGCATVSLPRYRPSFSEVGIRTDHAAGAQMLVSLVAVPADEKTEAPAGLEARIRLDNHADATARIDPESLDLVEANLASFPEPWVSPSGGLEVKPGGEGMLTARFPYPAQENADSDALESVHLRWKVDIGGNSYARGITFQRRESSVVYYSYPYPYPAYYWGPGWYDSWWWEPPVVVEEHLHGHGDRDRDRD